MKLDEMGEFLQNVVLVMLGGVLGAAIRHWYDQLKTRRGRDYADLYYDSERPW